MNDKEIEQAIQAKGKTAPRVTPADLQAAIVGEFYFTAREGLVGSNFQSADAVTRFLQWPVPADVYSDGTPGKTGRTGTNLLTASQARDMLDHVFAAVKVVPELQLLTFCVLVLKNGFTVTGESACASPENFDESIGRQIARANAVQKVWPLMGYALKQRIHDNAANHS